MAGTDATGSGIGGFTFNPAGNAGTGSGVTPLTNNSGQVVGYLANNSNAQYIARGPGTYKAPGRYTFALGSASRFTAMRITY